MKFHVDPAPGALLCLGGIAIGFCGAGLFFQRTLRAELDREIQDVKDHYQMRLRQILTRTSEPDVPVDEFGGDTGATEAEVEELASVTSFELVGEDGADADSTPADNRPRTNYAAASRLPPPVIIRDGERPQAGVTDEENVVAGLGTAPDPTRPYVISVEEFGELDEHQCLTITYWMKDDVLTDDKEAPMPDFARIVGADFLEHFGEQSGDENIVHIRNPRLQIDFEVARDFRAFSEVVLGVGYDTADPKKKKRPDSS
jgi:hypothetical protein